jgi:Predicted ATPase (AAA+ superfamily)
MLRGKNFAYLNFDDNELLNKWDEQQAEQLLSEIYPNYEYLLLDEVQNIDGWDVWVNKLYRRGVNLVITGSNAKMLSGEMATVLTGRYLEINMLPFSLAEASQFADRLGNARKNTRRFLEKRRLSRDFYSKVYYPKLFTDPFRFHSIQGYCQKA